MAYRALYQPEVVSVMTAWMLEWLAEPEPHTAGPSDSSGGKIPKEKRHAHLLRLAGEMRLTWR